MDLFRYLWLVLRLGIERVEKGEFMLGIGLFVVAPVIAVIVGFAYSLDAIQWAYAVISAFGFDLLVVIPARIGVRYVNQNRPRLLAEVIPEPQSGGREPISWWWWIKVTNPTNRAIEDCYAAVREFTCIYPPGNWRLPAPGHKLPWSRSSSGGGFLTTIAGYGSQAEIDLVSLNRLGAKYLRISSYPLDQGGRPDVDKFPLQPGVYDATVVIGSQKVEFKPTEIRVRITYKGSTSLDTGATITEIQDSGKEGS